MSHAEILRAQAAGKSHILIVDDDPHISDTMKDIVEDWGYAVSIAGTVADALRHIDQGVFNAILVDFNLPDGSGLELAAQVAKRSPGSRVILITGQAGLQKNADPEAVFSYLIKPVDPQELHTLLQKIIDQQR